MEVWETVGSRTPWSTGWIQESLQGWQGPGWGQGSVVTAENSLDMGLLHVKRHCFLLSRCFHLIVRAGTKATG